MSKTLKATFIVKNLDFISRLEKEENIGMRYSMLMDRYKQVRDVSIKIGDGSVRDNVTWNISKNKGFDFISMELGSRRGYSLATFEINI